MTLLYGRVLLQVSFPFLYCLNSFHSSLSPFLTSSLCQCGSPPHSLLFLSLSSCLSVSPIIDSSHSFPLQCSRQSPSRAPCFLFPLTICSLHTLTSSHYLLIGGTGGKGEAVYGVWEKAEQYFHKGYLRPLPLRSPFTISGRHTAGS